MLHVRVRPSGGQPALSTSPKNDGSSQAQVEIASLKEEIRISGGDAQLYDAMGEALFAAGRDEEAVGALLNAVRLNPESGVACAKIGRFYLSRGLVEPALVWLRRALGSEVPYEGCVPALAIAEMLRGRQDQVTEILNSWVAANPEDPIRKHLAAAIVGESTPAKADQEYARALFDDYASRFDESLARLNYCGPELVVEAITSLELLPDARKNILDVGCGTGLVGVAIRPFARWLVGIDLSPNMLRRADMRKVYDELVEAEMNAFMRSQQSRFDLVTAADVITYIGDLQDFCSAIEVALRPGGKAIVVLESCDESSEAPCYQLNASGRFSHREAYVRQSLEEHGFRIRFASRKPMRHEFGRPTRSLSIAAEKVAAT